MNRRHTLLLAVSVLALNSGRAVHAQAAPAPVEKELREALRNFEQAWNRHDVKAWSAHLTEDVWFTQAWDYYAKQKGRGNAVDLFKSNFLDTDFTHQVVRIKMMPDGTATVAKTIAVSYLPKTDGKYRMVFESNPVISRWKKEGSTWKMFFFTSHEGWARDQLKKDGIE
jgi:ketosteroid isomerase-like protein